MIGVAATLTISVARVRGTVTVMPIVNLDLSAALTTVSTFIPVLNLLPTVALLLLLTNAMATLMTGTAATF